jgi:hypothetical protein
VLREYDIVGIGVATKSIDLMGAVRQTGVRLEQRMNSLSDNQKSPLQADFLIGNMIAPYGLSGL